MFLNLNQNKVLILRSAFIRFYQIFILSKVLKSNLRQSAAMTILHLSLYFS